VKLRCFDFQISRNSVLCHFTKLIIMSALKGPIYYIKNLKIYLLPKKLKEHICYKRETLRISECI
jgi:hypothetical protein